MKRHKGDPVPKNALSGMWPGSNAELIERFPFLSPTALREKPVVCMISRNRSAAEVVRRGKDLRKGDQKIIARIGEVKFDTNTARDAIAFEHIKLIIDAFRPDKIKCDHRNGSMYELENQISAYQAELALHQSEDRANRRRKREARSDKQG